MRIPSLHRRLQATFKHMLKPIGKVEKVKISTRAQQRHQATRVRQLYGLPPSQDSTIFFAHVVLRDAEALKKVLAVSENATPLQAGYTAKQGVESMSLPESSFALSLSPSPSPSLSLSLSFSPLPPSLSLPLSHLQAGYTARQGFESMSLHPFPLHLFPGFVAWREVARRSSLCILFCFFKGKGAPSISYRVARDNQVRIPCRACICT